ncbi:MAG: hypothetical protein ACPIOQ_82450 [Promethearchaeia archaeon]
MDAQDSQAGVGKAHGQDRVEYVYTSLKSLYRRSILPLEEHYSFHDFFSPPLSDTDIEVLRRCRARLHEGGGQLWDVPQRCC